MPITVVNEGALSETIVAQDEAPSRFSWSAAIAGAVVAAGTTLLLLTLGSGVGLSLVSLRHATEGGTIAFLSLGAIYFLAAQAFGFAAGGHVTGRLIGPALETRREEEFRAGAHGLVAWAIAVVATAMLVALSAVLAGSAATGSVAGALAQTIPAGRSADPGQPAATSYVVDKLFRPANARQASLAWKEFAQADTGIGTDATASPPPAADPNAAPPEPESTPRGRLSDVGGFVASPANPVGGPASTTTPAPRSLGADKAEAGRILTVGMADGERLASEDRARLAQLVAADTSLTYEAALERVSRTEARLHDEAVEAAETARKTAAYASLWTALALLFGAIVAVAAAISAGWEDDREAGLAVSGGPAPFTA
jgi:hypothetical protein